MTDYTQVEDYSAKDALATGHVDKKIMGAELDSEFSALSTAVASKEDSANKGANSGYCGLDGSGLVDISDLPSTVKNASLVAANVNEMLPEVTTAHTVDSTDVGNYYYNNTGGTLELTFPDDSTIPPGAKWEIVNGPTVGSITTITAGTGVTIRWWTGSAITEFVTEASKTLPAERAVKIRKYSDTEYHMFSMPWITPAEM